MVVRVATCMTYRTGHRMEFTCKIARTEAPKCTLPAHIPAGMGAVEYKSPARSCPKKERATDGCKVRRLDLP